MAAIDSNYVSSAYTDESLWKSHGSASGTWGVCASYSWTASTRTLKITDFHGRRSYTASDLATNKGYYYVVRTDTGGWLYESDEDTLSYKFSHNAWSTEWWRHKDLGASISIPDNVGTVRVYYKSNTSDNTAINNVLFDCGTISVGKATWRINFNANGGSVNPTYKDISAGNSVTTPSATRTNASKVLNVNVNGGTVVSGGTTRTSSASYTANGWYTTSGGGTKRCGNGGSYTPSSAETVFQHWTLGSYGNVTLPTTAQFVKENYTLLGFSSSSSATVATWSPGASVAVSNNGDTVYAVWKRNQSQAKIKTGANTWKNGLVYVKTNNGWKQVLHSYVKTNSGWKENNES